MIIEFHVTCLSKEIFKKITTKNYIIDLTYERS